MDTITTINFKSDDATTVQRAIWTSNYALLAIVSSDAAGIAPLEPACAGDFALETRKGAIVQALLNWYASGETFTLPDFTDCNVQLPVEATE